MRNIYFVFALFFSLLGFSQNMENYANETKEMILLGNYKEAMKRNIWYQKNAVSVGKENIAVAMTETYSNWLNLANQYAPAKVYLVFRRDSLSNSLRAKSGVSNDFWEVCRINRILGERKLTIALLKEINDKDHLNAEKCWIFAKEDLMKEKKYQLLSKFLKDPKSLYNGYVEFYKMTNNLVNERGIAKEQLLKSTADIFVKDNLDLVEFAKAMNNLKLAKEIQTDALTHVDDERLRLALK